MTTTAPFQTFTQPPSPFDRCDVDNSAAAVVAFTIHTSSGPNRLTYCAHHWDRAPRHLLELVVSVYDKRKDGIFETPSSRP
jgi:hypothetical protein